MSFSDWILSKIDNIGGISILCERIPGLNPKDLSSWICGLQIPNYNSQIKLAEAFGCELSEIRSALGQPHTDFAELMVRKILAHGRLADFPRKTEIKASRLEKWLSKGALPYYQEYADHISEALIEWGDRTPKEILMAELIAAIEKSLEVRSASSISSKISKDCNSNRIAS